MDTEKFGGWCAAGAIVLFGVGLMMLVAWSMVTRESKRRAFMIECQDDNLKHYQCVSLWNGAGLPVSCGRDMPPLN